MSDGPDYAELRRIFEAKRYILTAHASSRAIERDIDDFEIEEAVIAGSVIEDYPDDKYSPSCLILGRTQSGRILHVHLCYPPKVKVITVYEPSPDEWEPDWKTRKP
ncbi:MAG: DUF4258 domain-containing protein [Chloroflexi bacterium]|nr:DUF4258 domain-containing protein [Chloroflexota bacterium]